MVLLYYNLITVLVTVTAEKIFTARDACLRRITAVVSVCLSVTSRYCLKTAEPIHLVLDTENRVSPKFYGQGAYFLLALFSPELWT